MFHIQLHPAEAEAAVEYAHKSLIACGGLPAIGALCDVPYADWAPDDFALCHGVHQGYVGWDFNLIGPPQPGGGPHPAARPDLQELPLDQWELQDFQDAVQAAVAIGDGPGVVGGLRICFNELNQIGALGLVRGGAMPVALVRTIGPYHFQPNPPDDWCWFRHRWPVEILGWYAGDNGRFALNLNPVGVGTCQRLVNPNRPLYLGLLRWQREIERETYMNHLANLITVQPNVILQGPPGTSKTYDALRLAAHLRGFNADAAFDRAHPDHAAFYAEKGDEWNIVQFHPAYNYEDFVRGIQVSTEDAAQPPVVRYDTIHRVFSEMCSRASEPENAEKKFVLIIDEINRANLAAVLGELIYALEYRGESIHTPYKVAGSGYSLAVPKNLYVIGTMNTADRSIGHIDYAVRRRFAFVPMLPNEEVIERHYPKNQELRASALKLFKAVQYLFTVGENCRLSPEFHKDDVQPGHTYFLVDENPAAAEACEKLIIKFVYQVLPLLREYV